MNKPWVVAKFGGTSVATVKTWGQIVGRVKELMPTNRVWIVVSALSKVTNALLSALDECTAPSLATEARFKSYNWIVGAHEKLAADMSLTKEEYAPVQSLLDELKRLLDGIMLTGEVSFKLRARIAAFGELLSSQLGVAFLRRSGLNANRVDSRSLLTSDVDEEKNLSEADIYLEADVKPSIQSDRANAASQGADVVICQGFIASTPTGATCLLGRGGSDTSGALFAALCGAQRCEIWTDVNGMFTADPRWVPKARLIRSLTYREAQELAAMGAKVLHPRCLLPAAFAGIPVEVRNTMDPSDEAEITVVSADGLDYQRKAKYSASAASSAAGSASGGAGATSIAGGHSRHGTPAFHAMPPARAPSPLSSSKLIYSTAPGSNGPAEGEDTTGFGVNGMASLSLDGANTPTDGNGSSSSSSPTSSIDNGRSSTPSPSARAGASSSGHHGAGHHHLHSHAAPSRGLVASSGPAKVLAVARRKGVTLVSMVAYDMWGNAGFLSKVFAPFGVHGVSVDLIATSQYAVSVTLDHIPDGVYGEPFRKVVASLSKICNVEVRYPCAVVSVVGRSLRNALPELGAAMKALRGVPVHMTSEASEDLNMSFVVDEEFSDKLVADLHGELLESDSVDKDHQFGPVWTEMPCGKAPLPDNGKTNL